MLDVTNFQRNILAGHESTIQPTTPRRWTMTSRSVLALLALIPPTYGARLFLACIQFRDAKCAEPLEWTRVPCLWMEYQVCDA